MSDLISRQDAIEVMAWAIWHYPNLSFLSDYGHAHELAEDALKRLPFTETKIIRCKDCKFYTPMNRETRTGICRLLMHQNFGDDWYCAGAERRKPMDDLISRQAMLYGLASIAKGKAKSDAQKSLMGRAIFFTEQLPSAQPDIIRCKDCAKRNNMGFCTIFQNNIHGIATSWHKPEDDGYCSYAERRTDG